MSAADRHAAGSASQRALCIGGLDPSGGAGIVIDAIVFARLGFAPVTVAGTVTAQNSRDFLGARPVHPRVVAQQLEAVAADGAFACAKIGAIGSSQAARVVAGHLRRQAPPVVVLDPVRTSSSGGSLYHGGAPALKELYGLATVITPNAHEAAEAVGAPVRDSAEARRAGERLAERFGCAVLVTGLPAEGRSAVDVLAAGGATTEHEHPVIEGLGDVRGTGCMLASALCAHLALGLALPEVVGTAQATLLELLRHARRVGPGRWQLDLGVLLGGEQRST